MLSNRRWFSGIVAEAAKFGQFAPVVLLWLASLSTAGPMYTSYGGGIGVKIAALGAPIVLGGVKLSAILSVLLIVILYISLYTGALKLSPAMRLPSLAMIVAAVLMPHSLCGSWRADLRLPVALPFVQIASTRLDVQRAGIVSSSARVSRRTRLCFDAHLARYRHPFR